jgi:transposase
MSIFSCEACGSALDRDLNAARNLAKLAYVAQSSWETKTPVEPTVRLSLLSKWQ